MSRPLFIFALLITSICSPFASAANQSETVTKEGTFTIDPLTISSWFEVPSNGSSVELYVCGYNIDRTIRGDCDGLSTTEAPGEVWFKFVIPSGTIGNQMTLNIENEGTPDYVDLKVILCFKTRHASSLFCEDKDDMYQGDTQSIKFFPVLRNEAWIQIIAFDETLKNRNPGGDLTYVNVKLSGNVNSNLDRVEPEEIFFGDQKDRAVCETGCAEGTVDPMDVFVFNGIAGDEVTLKFGSREYEGGCDLDVQVDIGHEFDYSNLSRTTSRYFLDDCGNYDTDRYVSSKTYLFIESGELYIIVKDLQGDNRRESYTIEVTDFDTTNRNYSVDFDQDGLPDYEETQCGSDFKNASDTAPNHDGDNACNDRDLDDDNDGIEDILDNCPYSSMSISDYDGDGCDNDEDSDDDNDGVEDSNDSCPRGVIGPSSNDVDGDGCADSEDTDNDNDGWSDTDEIACGTDQFDELSVPTNWDAQYEAYYLRTHGVDITECDAIDTDDDQDGIEDNIDACNFSVWYTYNTINGMLTTIDEDLDADGCFNKEEDDDDDNDGIPDVADPCPRGLLLGNDADGDGCKDGEDTDNDNDNYSSYIENECGTSDFDASSIPIGVEWDYDGDGQCDGIDTDDDGDGTPDTLDAFPLDETEQKDTDNDTLGDKADNDDDNDGVLDTEDAFPLNPQESKDTDGDGIGNNEDNDDDGDGWFDEDEYECQSNPVLQSSTPDDYDNDKICDLVDIDDDNDGWTDEQEIACGTDKTSFEIKPLDHDNDRVCDELDPDTDDDGIPNVRDDCQFTPLTQINDGDYDGDGCFDGGEDLDSDNDKISNLLDDCEKSAVTRSNDDDEDGCPDDPDLFETAFGKILLIILILSGVLCIIVSIVVLKIKSGNKIIQIGEHNIAHSPEAKIHYGQEGDYIGGSQNHSGGGHQNIGEGQQATDNGANIQ
jgi:hypothetical protein